MTQLPARARVLDLGCNDGSFCQLLQSNGYEITGVDFPEIIERARKSHPEIDFIGHDIEELDFPERTFDAIIAFGLIEHIFHDFELLEKAYKWLDVGGKIFLTTPLSPEKIVEQEAAHIRFYPPVSLSRLLELAGFTVINLEVFQKIDEYFIVGEKNGAKSVS
jgi:2-polyprenyl-3-methyl-5-hydroxy-6-metoxy-1,4-benzoquinol methylase